MYDLDRRLDALQAALADLGVIVEPVAVDAIARRVQAAVDAGQDKDIAIRHGALQLLSTLHDIPANMEIVRRPGRL